MWNCGAVGGHLLFLFLGIGHLHFSWLGYYWDFGLGNDPGFNGLCFSILNELNDIALQHPSFSACADHLAEIYLVLSRPHFDS